MFREKISIVFGVCKKVGADIPGLPPFIFDFEDVSLCDIPQRLGVGGIIPIRDLASSAVGLCNSLKPFLNLMANTLGVHNMHVTAHLGAVIANRLKCSFFGKK